MLFKNGINLSDSLLDFIENSNKLSIYIPYIKLAQLKYLLQSDPKVENIIVRWKPNDLILGSSDLEIYLFLKERGINLYRNPRLHLKAFLDSYQHAFIGSANISQRALNLPETHNHNYELGIIVENLSLSDRLYFQTIDAESSLITDKIYEDLKEQIVSLKLQFKLEDDFEFNFNYLASTFQISSLPMSEDIETLIKIYVNETSNDELALNCALHDLAIYQIPFGLNEVNFISELKSSFFKHPFIRAFLTNLNEVGMIYFGAAKEWIHQNCSDAPTPRKWEITSNIKILYRWIVSLSDGTYEVDKPNYSERLFKVNPQDTGISYFEKFISKLNRDKAHSEIAPHQMILLISFYNLYHMKLKMEFEFTDLTNEFYINWQKYHHLFKSKNDNIVMPLASLEKRGLLVISVLPPISYRNNNEVIQKIKSISFSDELIKFLETVNLDYLESRITN